MIPFNFHTHSHFCDGSDHPEVYIREALRNNFHSIGFTSHAPVPFSNGFAIQGNEKLVEYTTTIRGLQEKYAGEIDVYLGLEIDHIPGLMPDFSIYNDACNLDYTIGSVHLVKVDGARKLWFIDGPYPEIYDQGLAESFNNDIRLAVTSYWKQVSKMITEQELDVIGHIDKVKMHNRGRYFSEDEPWYRKLAFEALDCARDRGFIIEVNTRGLYKKRSKDYYPGIWMLREIRKMGIPVTLSSDAHKPEELTGHYIEAEEMLREMGFRELMVYRKDGWQAEGF